MCLGSILELGIIEVPSRQADAMKQLTSTFSSAEPIGSGGYPLLIKHPVTFSYFLISYRKYAFVHQL